MNKERSVASHLRVVALIRLTQYDEIRGLRYKRPAQEVLRGPNAARVISSLKIHRKDC